MENNLTKAVAGLRNKNASDISIAEVWSTLAEKKLLNALLEKDRTETVALSQELLGVYPALFWPLYHFTVTREVLKVFAESDPWKIKLCSGETVPIFMEQDVVDKGCGLELKGEGLSLNGSKIYSYAPIAKPWQLFIIAKRPYDGLEPYGDAAELKPALVSYAPEKGLEKYVQIISSSHCLISFSEVSLPVSVCVTDDKLLAKFFQALQWWKIQWAELAIQQGQAKYEEIVRETPVVGNYIYPNLSDALPVNLIQTIAISKSYQNLSAETLLLKSLLRQSEKELDGDTGFASAFLLRHAAPKSLWGLAQLLTHDLASLSPLYQQTITEIWMKLVSLQYDSVHYHVANYFDLEKLSIDKNSLHLWLQHWQSCLSAAPNQPELRQALGKGKELCSSLWVLADELQSNMTAVAPKALDEPWTEERTSAYMETPTAELWEVFGFAYSFYSLLGKALDLEEYFRTQKDEQGVELTWEGYNEKYIYSIIEYLANRKVPMVLAKIENMANKSFLDIVL